MYSKNRSLWIWLFVVAINMLAVPAYSETTNAEINSNPEPVAVSPISPVPATEANDLNSSAAPINNTPPATSEMTAQPVTPAAATEVTPVATAAIVYTKPYSVGFDKINTGDTAWMLSSTALVLLMTIPGLVLFYAGMVRKKNVLSTALQSFAICCLVSIIWIVIGYTIAFTPGTSPYLGGLDRLMLSGLGYIKATSQLTVSHLAPTIPESVFVMFQMTFAIITPALIVGAFAERMPRQLSGGQKQRVGIARAFAGGAKVVVADEPVSALDVSVQAAVTDLLMDIQRENKTTLLFISHDLSIVRYLSDRVMVMYLGHVVEMGTTDQVFQPPYHPYTEALLSAVPIADTKVIRKRIVLDGDIPSAMNPPPGCPFQTRCRWKSQVPGGLCERDMPPVQMLEGGHQVKCHLSADVLATMEPVIKVAAE